MDLLSKILPRHLSIIYDINSRFLRQVETRFPDDPGRLSRMSLINENHVKAVNMANLSIIGSHSVNGVSALHTEILKNRVFPDFHEMFPDRFLNITNGVTQRRWLKSCNPGLASLISESIGDSWITHLSDLNKLLLNMDDPGFQEQWRNIKKNNKAQLTKYIQKTLGLTVDPDSMFEVQIKRIHEYKRQVLNVLHVITLYNRIRRNPESVPVPRTVIFSGKAAPGYAMAKLIIKFINSVAQVINEDLSMKGRLKVIFLPNYSVTLAEKIIPAANLSDQISTAGMEASGTGNMKLALNGALTIGTLDGANIEILEEVGENNIFIFGLKADEVRKLKQSNYQPGDIYSNNDELREVLDMVRRGVFSADQQDLFEPIVASLLDHGDPYMVLADFSSFCKIQEATNREYLDVESWTKKSIINVAKIGKFSSDRSILEYVRNIWNTTPNQI